MHISLIALTWKSTKQDWDCITKATYAAFPWAIKRNKAFLKHALKTKILHFKKFYTLKMIVILQKHKITDVEDLQ